MSKKDIYIFPAIFTIESDGISVEFPDLVGCFSCGDTQEEAFMMAKDALGGHLYCLEEDNTEIPMPTKIDEIELDSNQFVALIEVIMPVLRLQLDSELETTNTTIPKWLKRLAEQKKVNFSKVLKDGLLEILGLPHIKGKS